ncbi:Susd and RagB outer membrane lipoprotein [Chitinophaga sp. CF118]|uniref:SusD/RagB family nutrient-binding outer membrane lipoprotein n=1 Tax=Chitinophaga sp. CF118 TaxID=1884367 RepID=UPI0008F10D84|nr:SusD/RagB family nutrient-binding outer membrane lipoprotein [Chitinophaga sp. CF118]SFD55919.1 Susd and RagB outer membrane lipoprotein [Chitinophaga sp. CF118]
MKHISNLVLIGTVLSMSACTKDFDSKNTNPGKVVNITNQEIPFMFSKAEAAASYTGGDYQVAQNLFADLYAQYFATTATYFPSDRYVMRFDWVKTHWSNHYTQVLPQLQTIFAFKEKNTAEYALAKLIWVFSFHRLTDYYGPVPYFHAGEAATSVPYDSQESIYDDLFKQLDSAITTLNANPDAKPYGNFDLIYSGNVAKWTKFANTLRLRLALRISKADPARAKTEAEKAVAAGVMTAVADDAMMIKSATVSSDGNGLSVISGWNEFRMSASMESMLRGYNDPRLPVYFQPAVKTGEYHGVRNGLTATQLNIEQNTNDYNSNVGSRWISWSTADKKWVYSYGTPQDIMHCAEAYFLRAEGALNGWNMGDNAQTLYETGIQMSLNQWGITDAAVITAYKTNAATPIAPGDQQGSAPVNSSPVKWAATEAQQREQIGTQKWLALYPDGFEGWAEVRRSGFPILYPVVNNDNADIPAGQAIRRIPFIELEKQTNGAAVTKAVTLLNGADNAFTPLWWDRN